MTVKIWTSVCEVAIIAIYVYSWNKKNEIMSLKITAQSAWNIDKLQIPIEIFEGLILLAVLIAFCVL